MTKNLMRGTAALAFAALPLLATSQSGYAADHAPEHASAAGPRADFDIRSALHDKCLATNGDNVEVQTCRGTGNQLWFWEGGKLRNRAELHCLDVRNGEIDAPAQAVGDCHGLANQQWKLEGSWLRSGVNRQCLSIQENGDPSEHAGINVRDCANVAWQFWKMPPE
ncbi:RICIN domain-containing protein [Streptomyces kanamyceticus]|uniref:RICIN domain-containing protein n=1 Tax=Streptomyces kanamyceticus TaxID=1967 RepID=UPI00123D0C71|nr:ricin-type beta-trefoil lectin domain protein [Streptomyces kanamyceticus]